MGVADDLDLVEYVSKHTDHSLSVELRYFHALRNLRNALRSIRDNTCCDGCGEAARVARDALDPPPPGLSRLGQQ